MNPIDKLVNEALERDAAGVDGREMLLRVRGVQTRRTWLKRSLGIGGAAVAASAGGYLFFGGSAPVALASAEEIIVESKTIHAVPTDRLYELSTEWDAAAFKLLPAPPSRTHRVWTRGDQFWAQPADDGNWCMGQEPGGRVWFAIGRKRGVVYEPSELGEPLMKFLDLVSLRMVSTLAELLEKFKLLRKDSGKPGEAIVIEAELKPSFLVRNPRFQFIRLELDPQSKVVRSASFERKVNGETVGRMKFVLKDTATLPDRDFELKGHLDADAEIVDKKTLDRRGRWRDEFLKKLQSRKS